MVDTTIVQVRGTVLRDFSYGIFHWNRELIIDDFLYEHLDL